MNHDIIQTWQMHPPRKHGLRGQLAMIHARKEVHGRRTELEWKQAVMMSSSKGKLEVTRHLRIAPVGCGGAG